MQCYKIEFMMWLKETENLSQLTDYKDGERLIYWCVTVGCLKGINATFWCFQSHQPQLTAETKHKKKKKKSPF